MGKNRSHHNRHKSKSKGKAKVALKDRSTLENSGNVKAKQPKSTIPSSSTRKTTTVQPKKSSSMGDLINSRVSKIIILVSLSAMAVTTVALGLV